MFRDNLAPLTVLEATSTMPNSPMPTNVYAPAILVSSIILRTMTGIRSETAVPTAMILNCFTAESNANRVIMMKPTVISMHMLLISNLEALGYKFVNRISVASR